MRSSAPRAAACVAAQSTASCDAGVPLYPTTIPALPSLMPPVLPRRPARRRANADRRAHPVGPKVPRIDDHRPYWAAPGAATLTCMITEERLPPSPAAEPGTSTDVAAPKRSGDKLVLGWLAFIVAVAALFAAFWAMKDRGDEGGAGASGGAAAATASATASAEVGMS